LALILLWKFAKLLPACGFLMMISMVG